MVPVESAARVKSAGRIEYAVPPNVRETWTEVEQAIGFLKEEGREGEG